MSKKKRGLNLIKFKSSKCKLTRLTVKTFSHVKDDDKLKVKKHKKK